MSAWTKGIEEALHQVLLPAGGCFLPGPQVRDRRLTQDLRPELAGQL